MELLQVFQVEDYLDIKKKAEELGYKTPESIAFLPQNFEEVTSKENLVYGDLTTTFRILWKQCGIVETPLEKSGEKIAEMTQKSLDLIAPFIFIASSFLSQNPELVDIALGVISEYLTDWFKGMPNWQNNVKLNVILENKSGGYKKVSYEGPTEGLKEISKVVRSLHDEKRS